MFSRLGGARDRQGKEGSGGSDGGVLSVPACSLNQTSRLQGKHGSTVSGATRGLLHI